MSERAHAVDGAVGRGLQGVRVAVEAVLQGLKGASRQEGEQTVRLL